MAVLRNSDILCKSSREGRSGGENLDTVIGRNQPRWLR